MRFAALLALGCIPAFAQSWVMQASNTKASLRAIGAVNQRVVWASGTQGTYLRTLDGGATWTAASVPDAKELDFRGLYAATADRAWLMSAGPGERSRIYRTDDGGTHWTLQFTNPDAKGFFDSIAFWTRERGIVVGDPVDGHFVIFTTDDGGRSWQRQQTPPALTQEGAFAASNTCLRAGPNGQAWFVTGGARVFHSSDYGRSWTVTTTPIRNDKPSAGIFSIAFASAKRGVIAGGDYAQPKERQGNVALTTDGGKTWIAPKQAPAGFRSAVLPVKGSWIATGTSGSDISKDGGQTWRNFDEGAFNALTGSGGTAWAAGPQGRIARLTSFGK
jgi:photosystem II stability/assembly factor-like uncharacterized protein